jgi:hypothetical protein
MFDALLASLMKNFFKEMFIKMEHVDLRTFQSIAVRTQIHTIEGLLDVWSKTASFENMSKSAVITEIVPFNPEKMLLNRFLHQLSDEERMCYIDRERRRKRHLDINSKILTTRENIKIIRNHLNQSKIPDYGRGFPVD